MPSNKIEQIASALRETLDIEVKNWLGGLTERTDQAKLAREIIALGNHGGGYIFIGFSDVEGHPEIQPRDNEERAFTQDIISGVVERYIEPSCQVNVETVQLAGSEIAHPVITVPGSHRTPLWAKRGAADEEILKNATIYIRRPGAKSEPPRTQDDWEKLIDRFVKSRQSELVAAMRSVLNPELTPSGVSTEALNNWEVEGKDKWVSYIANLPSNDPRRFTTGYWTASFYIEGFEISSISDLNSYLRDEFPSFSGSRPFFYSQDEGRRPISLGNVIEAWLGNFEATHGNNHIASISDFWRLSTLGYGYIIRSFSEDDPSYCSNRSPRPTPPNFDRVYHAYRVAELLRAIESLALRFSSRDANFTLKITYHGMLGRSLESSDFNWTFEHDGTSNVDIIESEISGSVALISTNLEEMIVSLLDTVYGHFDFGKTIPTVVANAAEFVSGRN